MFRPAFLQLCHVRNAFFTRAFDDDIVTWTEGMASVGAVKDCCALPVRELEFTKRSSVPCPSRLVSVEAYNGEAVAGQRSLQGVEMVRLRFGVIQVVNALARRCLPVVDVSQRRHSWSMAAMFKRYAHLLFQATKVALPLSVGLLRCGGGARREGG